MKKLVLMAALAAAASTAQAEGMKIQPGLWEIKSVMNMPNLAEPREMNLQQCMTEPELRPDSFGDENMAEDCEFTISETTATTMKWGFECQMEGGTSKGLWEATSSGDSITGGGEMQMEMQGQSMNMTMQWTGRRVGDCPAQ